jgi:DNA processing protein
LSALPEPHIPDSAIHWLRLALAKGIGPILGFKLIETCGSIAEIWEKGPGAWQKIYGFGPRLCDSLEASDAAKAEKILTECRQQNIHILCPDDSIYPASLREPSDAPLVLFALGDLHCLQRPRRIAVIGSRRASREGLVLAKRWCHYLSDRGICVVSGMAYGIDQAAHHGAISGASPTIAILGSGLGSLTPSQKSLVRSIAEKGCVLSEYPPSVAARPEHFPRRNRIISAISRAVLVMEANMRSGALITAKIAAEQGKEVMAVPGSVLTGSHAGCHYLIRDGALLVESAKDVLRAMGWDDLASSTADGKAYTPANRTEEKVLQLLQNEILQIDTLAERCGLTVSELASTLIGLELLGVVECLPGSRYALTRNT